MPSLRARYLFPVDRPPLRDGVVTIEADRIVEVGAAPVGRSPIDLGEVAILPGLVNAHTHLEFSRLAAPLGSLGQDLPSWIRHVIAWRETAGAQSPVIAQGLAESLRHGVTLVGEIASQPWADELLQTVTPQCVAFRELLGPTSQQIEPLWQAAQAYVQAEAAGAPVERGLSPHAPYTVHVSLLQRVCRLSAERRFAVAMHLAESPEEMELLASGSGPLAELLQQRGVWDPSSAPRGIRPLDYLELLSGACRALVVHGNYLTSDEIRFLAERADRMSLVYCPRTHAYFDHDQYPLAELLAAGATVAIGTDSRASNPDLSVLDELRFVRALYQLPPARILQLGTLDGARALGRHDRAGSLTPGKLADLAVVALPPGADDRSDPHRLLLDSRQPVVRTYVGGRLAWSADESVGA